MLNLADVYNAKSESDAKLKAIRLDFINNNTDSAANQYIDIDIVAFCSGEDAAVELAENRAFDDRVVSTVEGNGITFQLFDYDQTINKEKDSDGHWQWRDISEYFTFRDARYSGETDGPDKDGIVRGNHQNKQHDKDGFFRQHTTVERKLVNDYPVLDLTRNADGTQRTDANSNVLGKDNLLSADKRSLAYLFGGADDFAVTSYPVSNTILQKNGDTYSYDSAKNAVDYDATERVFKVREYSERNEESAKYGNSIGDFLPFNHTGGVVVGARDETPGLNAPYNIAKKDVNYWFGMRMDVEFIQSRDGKLHGEDMIFEFSGDDDVWVFIDDVLVLDLGGTHGTVYGSINFATGEIKQYLNWQDGKEDNTVEAANEADEATSFPTTLKACLEAAGVNTNDVLTEDGVYKNWSQHKLSFFYMERGAAVANCKIDFNLPTVENGTLNVSKEVSGTTSAEYTDAMYKFQLMKGETPIQISGVTDANGIFEVKGGETQVFNVSALDTGTYTVRELIPVSQAGKFEAVKVNSYSVVAGEEVTYGEVTYKPYTSETFNISSESIDKSFTFTFDNEVKAGGLRITKLVNRTDGVDDTSGTFQFRITLPKALAGTYPVTYSSDLSAGTTNGEVVFTAVDDKAVGVITLCHGQTATITEIPAFSGTLTAEEINSDGYAVKWTHGDNTQWSTSASVTDGLAPGDTIALICTNTTGAQLPSTGGMGTNVFTGLGITMMLGAGVLLMTQRRRREASFRS